MSHRLARSLTEGPITNNGPYVQDFEAVLGKYLGNEVVAFSSGQAALTAMLMAAGIHGREVILPSFTFAATPNAVLAAGGTPVFADIDPVTLTLNPLDVIAKITTNTAAILAVDAFGISADYEGLSVVAKDHNLMLLRDSAPAFGTQAPELHNVTGIYSLHATKQFAVGEGGILVTNDPMMKMAARRLRNFGLSPSGVWEGLGFNGKMTEISAIIGLESFKTWPGRLERRRATARSLQAMLTPIDSLVQFPEPSWQRTSWCYLPVMVKNASHRQNVVSKLAAESIYVREYYRAMHKEPAWESDDELPVTEWAANRIIALPCYESMTTDELNRLVDAMNRICE